MNQYNRTSIKGLYGLAFACLVPFAVNSASASILYHRGVDGTSISATANFSTTDDPAGANPGSVGASNDLVFFVQGVNGDRTVNLAGQNRTFNSLSFRNTGSTQINRATSTSTTTVNILTLGAGGFVVQSGSGAVSVSGPGQLVNMRASTSLPITQNSSSTLSFNRNWDSAETSGTTTLTLNGSGTGEVRFNGIIGNGTESNSLALTVNRPSAAVTSLSAANTFSGATHISSGILFLDSGGTLANTSSVTIGNGGVLRLRGSNVINSSAAITLQQGSTLQSSTQLARTLGNALQVTGDFTLGGEGQAITLTGAVDLGNGNRRVDLANSATLGGIISNGGMTINATNLNQTAVLTLSAANTYTGATLVQSGGLIVNGALHADSVVTVQADGRIGGNGTIEGNLTLDTGANLVFNPASTLTVLGTVILSDNFGVGNLVNADGSLLDWSLIQNDTYSIIGGTLSNFSNIANFGPANAFNIGDGRSAYFQNGSLQLVVIPEPRVYAVLLGLVSFSFVWLRRRNTRSSTP